MSGFFLRRRFDYIGLMLILASNVGLSHAHRCGDVNQNVQATTDPAVGAAGGSIAPGERSLSFWLSVTLKDFALPVPIDADADGKVNRGEVKAAKPALLALETTR